MITILVTKLPSLSQKNPKKEGAKEALWPFFRYLDFLLTRFKLTGLLSMSVDTHVKHGGLGNEQGVGNKVLGTRCWELRQTIELRQTNGRPSITTTTTTIASWACHAHRGLSQSDISPALGVDKV
eukprot:sb/3475659/